MKGVQCYELFGGIALKIHTFSFFFFSFSFSCCNHITVVLQSLQLLTRYISIGVIFCMWVSVT